VNVTRPDSTPTLKESSLEALGYICQDVRDLPHAGPILTAIVHGMRDEETSNYIRLAATTALLNSLDFAKHNFENEVLANLTFCNMARCSPCTE
jgi:importin subunit beta-1